MKKLTYLIFFFSLCSSLVIAQEKKADKKPTGHLNTNKFRGLYQEFATPNIYRSASGVPGAKYYQQQADYKMTIRLDDAKRKLYGEETITYTNNSPDKLRYLWLQLDQNIRSKDAPTKLIESASVSKFDLPKNFVENALTEDFDGGFNIEKVSKTNGENLPYIINQTMMRIDLPAPLESGRKFKFNVKWWYNINDHVAKRGRSGYEYFPKDDNNLYVIAQFFPRMCVYDDIEGWQNNQFWGRGEFALPFGNYQVTISAPSDHILDGTGVLTNRKEVFSDQEYKRWEQAENSFDKPVMIVNQKEAEQKEKTKSTTYKKWIFKATKVRDFAFASSRKFIYDAMAVNIMGKKVMAVSMYPKEGNPLWEEYSTRVIANTLKSYSKYTFQFPYHKAISVHSKNQGMEYPMICWNRGRPKEDGTYSDRVKSDMISVITHEIGHNFFPMIVNSDERQWTWMDEGLNSFMQYLAEQSFGKEYFPELEAYPSRRGPAKNIIPYMSSDQDNMTPIMSNSENIYQFGNNAYGKPATALNILREVVMGHELFDYSFKTYAQRWMFKHPSPEDFFRTMEDASAINLDWFWRSWFYTTDYVDIGIKDVKQYYLTDKPNKAFKDFVTKYNIDISEIPPLVYSISEDSLSSEEKINQKKLLEQSEHLSDYIKKNYTGEKTSELKHPKYIYEVSFEKPGGIPMPIIVRYDYDDDSSETIKYPAMIWRLNDKEVSKVLVSEKKLVKVTIDPEEKTADINTSNNFFPKQEEASEFDKFKNSLGK